MKVEPHSSLQPVLPWNYIQNDQSYGATVSLTVALSLVYKYGLFVCAMTDSNRMIFEFGSRPLCCSQSGHFLLVWE